MDKISVVVPCYNEAKVLHLFYEEITNVISQMQEVAFEVILVNDGSKDETLDICKMLAKKDNNIKYISLSRNFGKEAAMFAGFEKATGNYVVLMDADLQDPPNLLKEMYLEIKNGGHDSVATRRVSRVGEPPIRSLFARLFYKLMNKITDVDIQDGARDYRMMNRKFLDALLELKEKNRFSKGLFGWVGFDTKWIEYENQERAAGETKWSFWKLVKYSIEGIVSFSTMPLLMATFIGGLCCLLAIIMIFVVAIRTLVFGDPVQGWTSTICVILLIGGIQLFTIGILGQYLAKLFIEIKNRPIYIIKEDNLSND